ncbi:lipid-A-disaccharide synthase [Candidatus Hepatobacter penaei]|uniref:lipid-A-disaccharide synthase n=1 Tax=Candidatus Hepatobacter penaei TaxID=1274402 RepID=UPI000699088A|nr:lipid-A-disaccharide synthase [Candidatus Hepatobacter penaei]
MVTNKEGVKDNIKKGVPQQRGQTRPLSVCIVVGEPSGDVLGKAVIEALQKSGTAYTFWGIGGPSMMKAGTFTSEVPLATLSLGGLSFVKKGLTLVRALIKMRRQLRRRPTDILITIDAPDFTLRLAKSAPSSLVKVHCVAPSVWAWRPGRARKVAAFLDHLCTLFAFEGPYFEKHGLATTFVGHPTADWGYDASRDVPLEALCPGLSPKRPILLLMPGSRMQELKAMASLFLTIGQKAQTCSPPPQIVVLTLPHLKQEVQKYVDISLGKGYVVAFEDVKQRLSLMRAATLALVASGTSTLELAMAECPMVVAYQVTPLLAWGLRRVLTTPVVSLPNILLGTTVVPECLQEACCEAGVWPHVNYLLQHTQARAKQKEQLLSLAEKVRASHAFGQGVALAVAKAYAKKKASQI